MTEVSIHEAKTHLSRLIRRVATGEEIVIRRGDKPVARLVAYTAPASRQFGLDRGLFEVPDDFDEPLSDEVLQEFER